MTFTIIGIDKKNGEIGIASFSKAIAVGGIVPEIDLNIGAIAVQSYPNPLHKRGALNLLKKGNSPEKTIGFLISKDKDKEIRQILLMDNKGNCFGFTGKKNIEFAEHIIGKDCIVGGNMLSDKKSILKIKNAFENSKGTLVKRLIHALKSVGMKGDKRNKKFGSSYIIIEKKDRGVLGIGNRYIDLRVDYSKRAIDDLNTLLKIRLKHEKFHNQIK